MRSLELTKEKIRHLFETSFLNVYDICYEEGKHYYEASRRNINDLTALYDDKEFGAMIPDAVTLFVILRIAEEDKLLLFYEYRYPAGRFLLSPPAGLIDEPDRAKGIEEAVFNTSVRELYEETGIEFKDGDIYRLLNPGVFSSPGMTDESNALSMIVISDPDLKSLTDKNTVGSEFFDGFVLLDKKDALKILKKGRDEMGNNYSVYTWQALLMFVSDIWKDY